MGNILEPNARQILTDDSQLNSVDKIIDRKEEQKQLEEEVFNEILEDNLGVSTTYIYGPSGTGKTYTVNIKSNEVERKADPATFEKVYVNGRKYDTYHKFLMKVLDQLSDRLPTTFRGDVYEKIPPSGHSTNFFYDLLKHLLEEKNFRLLAVVDEIDKLSLDDAGQVISMFWDLRSSGYDVQLVSISNDPIMLEKFSEDINRRIGNKIHFPTYDSQQLYLILEKFAKEALKDHAWDSDKNGVEGTQDADLKRIANEAAQTSGSASEAKKLLYHVASKSDGELNADNIEEARDKVEKQMVKEEVTTKPTHHIVALQAVAQGHMEYQEAQRKSGSSDQHAPTTQAIEEKYEELCEEYGLEPKSRRTIIRMLNSLEKDDLISSNIEGLGQGKGVVKLHVPMYDAMIYDELARETLENDPSLAVA